MEIRVDETINEILIGELTGHVTRTEGLSKTRADFRKRRINDLTTDRQDSEIVLTNSATILISGQTG